MATYRVTINYRQQRATWSEVFYRNETSLENAAKFSTDFYDAAIQFRSPLVVLESIVVQDLANPRLALPIRRQAKSTSDTDQAPDVTSTAAVYRLRANSPPAVRTLWLRGIRDQDVTRSEVTGADVPTGKLPNGWKAYYAALRAHNMGVYALIPISADPYVFTPCLSVTVQADKRVLLTMNGTFTLTAKKRVILSQFDPKLFPGLNGHWSPLGVTTNTLLLGYRSPLAPAVYDVTKARIRPEEYRFCAFAADGDEFVGFNKHDTKGALPFGRGAKKRVSLRYR